jgi:hypothetical protein
MSRFVSASKLIETACDQAVEDLNALQTPAQQGQAKRQRVNKYTLHLVSSACREIDESTAFTLSNLKRREKSNELDGHAAHFAQSAIKNAFSSIPASRGSSVVVDRVQRLNLKETKEILSKIPLRSSDNVWLAAGEPLVRSTAAGAFLPFFSLGWNEHEHIVPLAFNVGLNLMGIPGADMDAGEVMARLLVGTIAGIMIARKKIFPKLPDLLAVAHEKSEALPNWLSKPVQSSIKSAIKWGELDYLNKPIPFLKNPVTDPSRTGQMLNFYFGADSELNSKYATVVKQKFGKTGELENVSDEQLIAPDNKEDFKRRIFTNLSRVAFATFTSVVLSGGVVSVATLLTPAALLPIAIWQAKKGAEYNPLAAIMRLKEWARESPSFSDALDFKKNFLSTVEHAFPAQNEIRLVTKPSKVFKNHAEEILDSGSIKPDDIQSLINIFGKHNVKEFWDQSSGQRGYEFRVGGRGGVLRVVPDTSVKDSLSVRIPDSVKELLLESLTAKVEISGGPEHGVHNQRQAAPTSKSSLSI